MARPASSSQSPVPKKKKSTDGQKDTPQKVAPAKKPRKPKTASTASGKQANSSTKTRKPRTSTPKKSRKNSSPKAPISTRLRLLLTVLEVSGLLFSLLMVVVVVLGFAAGKYAGIDFLYHQLPFLSAVLGLILFCALFLIGWFRLRRWLLNYFVFLPAALALALSFTIGGISLQGECFFAISQFRVLVGGKEEAARVTLTHQVYAAYRRFNMTQEQQILDRARGYVDAIDAAAKYYDIDPDLLNGVAATESSFLPRESKDGGQGLFQITNIPQPVMQEVKSTLGVTSFNLNEQKQNAFLAAATLKYYLKEMNHDLFLGLLAYNIGPKNGGLRFIMRQYGATDFITIQPYLQQLPRDYPIRVLSHALAFRLLRKMGKLPAYEEGLNAVRIQHIGIPGL